MKTFASALLLTLLLAAGCAVGPRLENTVQMAVPLEAGSRFNGRTPLAGRVAVGTVMTEGKKWLMGGSTYAYMEEFKDALKRSLEDTQLGALGNPGYVLHAVVSRAEADPAGDEFTLSVAYTLVPVSGGAPIVQRTITTSQGSAKNDPNLEGAPKDLARNGAFRRNIEQAIETLYRVKQQK